MLQPIGIAWVGLFAVSLPRLVAFYSGIVVCASSTVMSVGAIFDAGGGALFEIWGGGISAPVGSLRTNSRSRRFSRS